MQQPVKLSLPTDTEYLRTIFLHITSLVTLSTLKVDYVEEADVWVIFLSENVI